VGGLDGRGRIGQKSETVYFHCCLWAFDQRGKVLVEEKNARRFLLYVVGVFGVLARIPRDVLWV
jgi:hypothetical protein